MYQGKWKQWKQWMGRCAMGLIASIVMVPAMSAASEEPKPDVQPFIELSTKRTMVPVRFVSEQLGAKVDWHAAEKKVVMEYQGVKITLYANEYEASVNQSPILLDAKAMIRQQRVFVPLRFISETFGAKVSWMGTEEMVVISAKEKEIRLKINRFEVERTGKYIGQVDPHTIEVETSDGINAYQLPDGMVDSSLSLEDNARVTIKFYQDQNSQRILTELSEAEEGFENESFQNVTVEKSRDRYIVKGEARVFEGVFYYVVEDGHYQLVKGVAKAREGAPKWSPFQFAVDVQKIREGSSLTLILYEESQQDGRAWHELLIPLES